MITYCVVLERGGGGRGAGVPTAGGVRGKRLARTLASIARLGPHWEVGGGRVLVLDGGAGEGLDRAAWARVPSPAGPLPVVWRRRGELSAADGRTGVLEAALRAGCDVDGGGGGGGGGDGWIVMLPAGVKVRRRGWLASLAGAEERVHALAPTVRRVRGKGTVSLATAGCVTGLVACVRTRIAAGLLPLALTPASGAHLMLSAAVMARGGLVEWSPAMQVSRGRGRARRTARATRLFRVARGMAGTLLMLSPPERARDVPHLVRALLMPRARTVRQRRAVRAGVARGVRERLTETLPTLGAEEFDALLGVARAREALRVQLAGVLRARAARGRTFPLRVALVDEGAGAGLILRALRMAGDDLERAGAGRVRVVQAGDGAEVVTPGVIDPWANLRACAARARASRGVIVAAGWLPGEVGEVGAGGVRVA